MPRTDLLLADPRLAEAERRLGRELVKAAVGRAQQRARDGQIAPDEVADAAVAELPARAAGLTPVINATGVLVHTNLGRAPLSAAAVDAIAAAAGHCDLEFDLTTGIRARRGAGALDALARAVPAAEAVAVVNNNAAAPRRARIPVARSNSTSQWPAAAAIASTAAADSGARPRLVCTSTPVALITGVSAAARAGSSATAASATSSGLICPSLARCCARPTAALTSARPSLPSAAASLGSASSRSVRGTRRLLSTSRTILRHNPRRSG